MNYFADNIKLLLSRKGLSHAELSAKIGFGRTTVTGYANGYLPTNKRLNILAEFFDISPKDLLWSDLSIEGNLNAAIEESKKIKKGNLKGKPNGNLKGKKKQYQQQDKNTLAADEGPESSKRDVFISSSSNPGDLAMVRDLIARLNARLKLVEDQLADLRKKGV